MQGMVDQDTEIQGKVDVDRSRKIRDSFSSGREKGDHITIHNGKKLKQVCVSSEYVLSEVEKTSRNWSQSYK